MKKKIVLVLLALVFVTNPVFAGNNVKVCHFPPGNPENAHIIHISENALPAHLAHGDFIMEPGLSCPPENNFTPTPVPTQIFTPTPVSTIIPPVEFENNLYLPLIPVECRFWLGVCYP